MTDPQQACRQKRYFADPAVARRYALYATADCGQEVGVYRCEICGGLHLSRTEPLYPPPPRTWTRGRRKKR